MRKNFLAGPIAISLLLTAPLAHTNESLTFMREGALREATEALRHVQVGEAQTQEIENLKRQSDAAVIPKVNTRITLPAVPGDSAGPRQGFVRVINLTPSDGEVLIYAIDETGATFGPAALRLRGLQGLQFNSHDLEHGNTPIGLEGGVGDGIGMWRLELATDLLLMHASAYIRTTDGFLTGMSEPAKPHPSQILSDMYLVPFFNPASNRSIQSWLRVINPYSERLAVGILGYDAEGTYQGRVGLLLPAQATAMISAQQLEEGDPYLTGSLGDGVGKWQFLVSGATRTSLSAGEFVPFPVMSLLYTRSGHLSNVSR